MLATNSKIRNKIPYRLLVFFLCVAAFSQLLPALRSMDFRSGQGFVSTEDVYHSNWGFGAVLRTGVQDLSDLYVAERLAVTPFDYPYYVTGKRGTSTNVMAGENIIRDYVYSIRVDGYETSYGSALPANMNLGLDASYYPDLQIGFSQQDMDAARAYYEYAKEAAELHPVRSAVFSFLFVASLIELLYITGRRDDGTIHLSALDRWPTELFMAVFLILGMIGLEALRNWVHIPVYEPMNRYNPAEADLPAYLLLVILFAVLFSIFLVMVRKIKAGRYLDDTVLYRALRATARVLRGNTADETGLERILTMATRYVLASALLVLLLVYFLNAMSFGNGWQFVFFVGTGLLLLAVTARFLYALRQILKRTQTSVRTAVDDQLKAERLKVDLVTNVSHDLNTPLTSIIGYADLLQDEEMSSEAAEYVEVLRKKSLRLKGIVSDLFDLSKSTSGAIELNREELDYAVLVRQTVSDLKDVIEKGERELVVKLPDEPVWVCADGNQLYRVLQNLIDNALRYSLASTRIFLRLETGDDAVHLTLKNTSAYPLDFDHEEILSRFVRGDLSRSTDGSGLGLAIAKSFTENNEGSFQVFAEEDVFIAMQTLKTIAPPEKKDRHSQ